MARKIISIFLILVIIAELAAIGFLLFKKFQPEIQKTEPEKVISSPATTFESLLSSPTPSSNPQAVETIDTSTWQTYTNPEFGYSIKIPNNLMELKGYSYKVKVFEEDQIRKLTLSISVIEADLKTKADYKSIKNLKLGEIFDDGDMIRIKDYNLDGCQAPGFSGISGEFFIGLFCAGEKQLISFYLSVPEEELETQKPIFETIISTFKFNNFKL